MTDTGPFGPFLSTMGEIVSPFSFVDGNVLVKASDTIVYRLHASVLCQASTYFSQVLSQRNRIGELTELDMSEESVANIQSLLGVIYNIEGCVIINLFQWSMTQDVEQSLHQLRTNCAPDVKGGVTHVP